MIAGDCVPAPVSFLSSSLVLPQSLPGALRSGVLGAASPRSRPARRRLAGGPSGPPPSLPPGRGPRSRGAPDDRTPLQAATLGPCSPAARGRRGMWVLPRRAPWNGVLNIHVGAQNTGRRGPQALGSPRRRDVRTLEPERTCRDSLFIPSRSRPNQTRDIYWFGGRVASRPGSNTVLGNTLL